MGCYPMVTSVKGITGNESACDTSLEANMEQEEPCRTVARGPDGGLQQAGKDGKSSDSKSDKAVIVQ
jgi:hypothetical protein